MNNDSSNKKNSKIENRRTTSQRVEIIECLKDGHHQHTILDIVNHLKAKNPNVNIATVYNNIKVLLDDGIIDVYPSYDSKNQRYELIDSNNFHIHIRDFENKKEFSLELPNNLFNEIKSLVKSKNYEIKNIKLDVVVKKNKRE